MFERSRLDRIKRGTPPRFARGLNQCSHFDKNPGNFYIIGKPHSSTTTLEWRRVENLLISQCSSTSYFHESKKRRNREKWEGFWTYVEGQPMSVTIPRSCVGITLDVSEKIITLLFTDVFEVWIACIRTVLTHRRILLKPLSSELQPSYTRKYSHANGVSDAIILRLSV